METCPRAADGLGDHLQGVLLADHALAQLVFQVEEVDRFLAFGLGEGDAGHLGDDLGDDVFVHLEAVGDACFLPGVAGVIQGLSDLVLLVAQTGGSLVVLIGDGLLLLLHHLGELGFQVANLCGHCHRRDAHASARLVDDVNGLVRQMPVAHIAF